MGRGSDEGSGDVEIGQDGGRVGRASDGDEDAMGNTVYDVPIAIAGVHYPIAGHPTPSTSLFDFANVSRYRHLTVQPHLRVAK